MAVLKPNPVYELPARVRRFIVENFYVAEGAALDDEASLIDSGIVDSTGVLELIAFLESEFGVSVADDEVTPENLETVGRIARFVARRLPCSRT